MNGRGVFPARETEARAYPDISGEGRTSHHPQIFQELPMSKRTIDLTADEEIPQHDADMLPEDNRAEHPEPPPLRQVLRARRAAQVFPTEPGALLPSYETNGPTQTSGATAGTTTTHATSAPRDSLSFSGLPDHMGDDVFNDEVVLTSFVIFRFFVEFPPEVTQLLCEWICKVFGLRSALLERISLRSSGPLYFIDPADRMNYGYFNTAPPPTVGYDYFRSLCRTPVSFCTFISRVFVNIVQFQRAEFALRQLEQKWKRDLAHILATHFPGKKAMLTEQKPKVAGAVARVKIPSVLVAVSDLFGNVIRYFQFTGLGFSRGTFEVYLTVAVGDDFRDLEGHRVIRSHIPFNLQAAIHADQGQVGFENLVGQPGLRIVTSDADNSRMTFIIKENDEDDVSFRFIVEKGDK